MNPSSSTFFCFFIAASFFVAEVLRFEAELEVEATRGDEPEPEAIGFVEVEATGEAIS